MKVTLTAAEDDWKPVTIQLTLETQDEAEAFTALCGWHSDVAEGASKNLLGEKQRRVRSTVEKLLSGIYYKVVNGTVLKSLEGLR